MEIARENLSMEFGKSQSKKEVILQAPRDKKKVHFATLMDICNLENAEFRSRAPWAA